MRQLATLNLSTVVTNADLDRACAAVSEQLRRDLSPEWDLIPALVKLYPDADKVPDGVALLIVMDDGGQAGQLGYHAETPSGVEYARVFAKPVLENGGSVLTGNPSVSMVVSHEACEWIVDPMVTFWADGPDGSYALEVCDPVQYEMYTIDAVSVSDFVTPAYFNKNAVAGSAIDYLGRLTAPFTLTPGGCITKRVNGQPQTNCGPNVPVWRQETLSPAARTSRRSTFEPSARSLADSTLQLYWLFMAF